MSTIFNRLTNLVTNVTGILGVSNGGSGVATASANTVFSGPTSGGATAPAFRALVSADIPAYTETINSTTGTINDLAWTTNVLRFNGASAVTLNGVAAQSEGTELIIYNDMSGTLTIADAAAGSTAANRFSIRNSTGSLATNIQLTASSSLTFRYLGSRWRPISPNDSVGDTILNAEVDKAFTASGTIQNIDSITLPIGLWHVFAGGNLLNGATTAYTDEYDFMLSIVSNASAGTASGYDYCRVVPGNAAGSTVSNFQLSVRAEKIVPSDGTQVVWLNHKATYGVTSAPTTRASMWAVKIR